MSHILFALASHTPLAVRESAPALVAERFGGIAATTELVGVRDFGRLYRMQERSNESSQS